MKHHWGWLLGAILKHLLSNTSVTCNRLIPLDYFVQTRTKHETTTLNCTAFRHLIPQHSLFASNPATT